MRARRGIGLVEALISLAIAAVLLTGVAGAFRVSAEAIDINDQFFRASQAGRVSLNRILTQVRRGSVDEASTSSSLHLITDSNQDLTYSYDSVNQLLDLTVNSTATTSILAHNVTACQFLIQLGTDYNNAACVSRVTMQITVQVGANSVLLTDSAAPRRNIVY
jgi:hypothetical protein